MAEEDGSETAGDEDIMEVMQKVEIIRRRMANVDADEEERRRRRRRAEADALIARLGEDKVRQHRLTRGKEAIFTGISRQHLDLLIILLGGRLITVLVLLLVLVLLNYGIETSCTTAIVAKRATKANAQDLSSG